MFAVSNLQSCQSPSMRTRSSLGFFASGDWTALAEAIADAVTTQVYDEEDMGRARNQLQGAVTEAMVGIVHALVDVLRCNSYNLVIDEKPPSTS
jgi:hypothetical protein